MDAITFRLAEPDDLDEIVTLSEGIYQGHDSLPLMFHKWLRTNNMAVILAQSSDNKLISLIAYFIVDDRQTFVRRFERIHQDLRGQDLRSNIDHILEDCNELFAEDFVDDSIPRSISFGTYLPTEKFLDWRTAIYLDDLTLFEAHLLHQLNRACEFIKSDFFWFVFMTRGGQNSRKSD